jgi:hypothetical protein
MSSTSFDEKFLDQLHSFFLLPPDEFAELTLDRIPEPTRKFFRTANETATRFQNHVDKIEHLLSNSGTPPVSFVGHLVSEQTGPWHRGKQTTRWIDLAIYRTEAGKFVSGIIFKSTWKGECERHKVTYGDLKECVQALQDWKPSEQLVGVGYPNPDNQQFRARQQRLMASMDALYADRLSRLLEVLPADEIATRLA